MDSDRKRQPTSNIVVVIQESRVILAALLVFARREPRGRQDATCLEAKRDTQFWQVKGGIVLDNHVDILLKSPKES